jgi:hypothetical protein
VHKSTRYILYILCCAAGPHRLQPSNMHLWIAIKFSPLCLFRDPATHLNYCRLDNRWFLPAFFDYRYAVHVELIITQPCTRSARTPCPVCNKVPKAAAQQQYDFKHYLTYSVDAAKGCVYRSTKRHVVPPVVMEANEEYWLYWKLPTANAQIAFHFLESQLGKPIQPRFALNFWLLCRRRGVLRDSDYTQATHWYCSELAAAVLLLSLPAFGSVSIQDPCLISPCMLESILRDLVEAHQAQADVPRIPPMPSVRHLV